MAKRGIAVGLLCAVLGSPLGAGEHLVPPGQVRAVLTDAARTRSEDLAHLDSLLSRVPTRQVRLPVGASPERLRRGLALLSDAELRDLAARTQALESDPSAGHWGEKLGIGVLVAAGVLLVAYVAYWSQWCKGDGECL